MASSRGVKVAWTAVAGLGTLLVVLVGVLTPWDPLPGAEIAQAPWQEFFTAADKARSDAYFDAVKWASWANLALSLLIAALVAFTAAGRTLVDAVRDRSRRWWVQVVLLVAAVTLIIRVATLPGSAWIQHVSQDYGLSTQSWGAWFVDLVKSLGLSLVLTSAGVLLLVWVARRFTRTWFVWASVGAAGLVFALSFAYPVLVEPLFNKFTPLDDGPLRTELIELADESGVDVSDVLVADASRRTTALNAYVSGFGASKRIVIYDTLLTSASDAEIASIVAHELGHASRDDVLVGTLEGAVAAALAMPALFLVLRPPLLRRAAGAGSVGDPAVVPVVLGLAALVGFVVMPVENTISRHVEARADAHALDLTEDPDTFIEIQQRLAVTNLSHLEPNPVLSFWFRSHPETLDRIGMALAWEQLHAD